MKTEKNLRDLKHRYSAQLLNQKGICGVGIEKDETDNFILAIHLDDSAPENLDLPKEFEDYPVKFIEQNGGFRKFDAKSEVQSKK